MALREASMHKVQGRLYLHRASVGDEMACRSIRDTITPLLKDCCARGVIAGYRRFVIGSIEDAENELLPYMFDYERETAGQFPFVFAGVQPQDDSSFDVDAVMQREGFDRVGDDAPGHGA
jgi:hypothetical protein